MKKTLLDMMDNAASTWPMEPYALRKTDGGYVASTFSEVRDASRAFAAWLILSGFNPGDRLAIIGEGSPEWMEGEFGAFYAGLVSVPLSVKLHPAEITFRLDHSETKAILTTHNELTALLPLLTQPGKAPIVVVYLDDDIAWGRALAVTAGLEARLFKGFSEAVTAGRAALADSSSPLAAKLASIAEAVDEDTLATISYTSGTMGNPKGVMLSHRSFWTNSHDLSMRFDTPRFRTLLILPTDHSFIHTSAIFTALWSGVALFFVDARGGSLAMLRNIPGNIQECQPTFLFTVPALTVNFMKKIIAGVEKKGPFAAWLFKAGIEAGAKWIGDGFHAPPLGERIAAFFPYFCAKTILFGTIRKKALGNSITFCMSGGSRLDLQQQKFFTALGVPLFQGYGLTEAGPVVSASTFGCWKMGTMGSLLPSINCAIMGEDGTELPTGQTGEITVTGDSVMMGYYENPEATASALRDGRLWTGDLGFMDKDGFLTVVGRERALLISESGVKCSPEIIEEAILAGTGLIEQAMAWCLYRKHACAIVSLDIARTKAFIDRKGIRTAEQLCRALQNEFYRFRNGGKDQPIQERWIPIAFQIVGRQFGEQDGTINSTMKLVRRKVEELYGDLIEYSYTDEGSTTVNPRNIATLEALFGL